jgi:hydroxyquinol 1,2-dioxygenase
LSTARATTPEDITAAVVESFGAAEDPRLREVLECLVQHLHAFAQEVGLTQEEWEAGIGFLTDVGHITDEKRQEFILLSDTLGFSMLVDALNHTAPGATESTVQGPFWVPSSPLRAYGESIEDETAEVAGSPTWVFGRVTDTVGEPVASAEIDVWQNAEDQLYTVQNPDAPENHLRGRFLTREDGSYAFLAVRPTPYPILDDGPVGRMLEATGRHPWRPAHIHMIVSAFGYRKLTTHIFDSESTYLGSDAVFAVKPSLLRAFERRGADDPARPDGVSGEWFSVENDMVLAPDS